MAWGKGRATSIEHCWANGFYRLAKEKREGKVFWEPIGKTTQDSKQGKERNPTVHCQRAVIYSYGRHWITGILDIPGKRVFLCRDTYSSSTGSHQSAVRQAVNESLTPNVYRLNQINMKAVWSELEYGTHKNAGEHKIKEIIIHDARLIAHKSIQDFKGKGYSKKRHSPRMSMYLDSSYERAVGDINAVRLLQGKTALLPSQPRLNFFKAARVLRESLSAERRIKERAAAKVRELKEMCTPKRYEEWKENRLGWKDPSKKKESYFYRNAPISLSVEGNHVHTSNGNQVTVSTARRVLALWDSAVHGHKTYASKEMMVGNYQGVSLRYNGTVKIGCTRILPDEVLRLKNVLQTTGVGNETETETEI